MEDEKKRKKKNKKKNKQASAAAAARVIEDSKLAASDQNIHTPGSEQNHDVQVLEDEEVEAEANPHVNLSTGTKEDNLSETEKKTLLVKEAMLEEKVKQLEIDKVSCIQREAVLEKKITDLQKEEEFWLQQEASMYHKLKELLNGEANWTLKGASLEGRIEQLEKEKRSWILKENSMNETIDRLNKVYGEVQAQVKVLQESRDGLLQENQQLMERLSVLQSQIQHLEEKSSFSASSRTKTEQVQHVIHDVEANSQMEAEGSLEEKLLTENADLVEKGPNLATRISETAPVDNDTYESRETIPNTEEKVESSISIQTRVEVATADHAEKSSKNLEEIIAEDSVASYETGESEENVQIPLDENEIQEVEIQDENADEKAGVAFTDAPLTGAPFRFISFFARYVSGADLVNKSNSNSGQ